MINTTIFKSAFILLVVVSNCATGHPVEPDHADILQSSKPPSEDKPAVEAGDHYDQRQNGTKNFRLHVDGVVFVVAPVEAMLLASELDPTSLLGLGNEGAKPQAGKPETRKPAAILVDGDKPIRQKSAHSYGLRLSNLLGPILRRISP